MSYQDAEDFWEDDSFVAWVRQGHDSSFWEDYFRQHPEKKIVAEQAKALILAASTLPEVRPAEPQVDRMWQHIERGMHPAPRRRLFGTAGWAAAACVLVLLFTSFYFYFRPRASVYHELVSQAGTSLRETVNETDRTQQVRLADGSTVDLAPGSRISYSADFKNLPRREVYLTGNAFFTVTKNPRQPFLVYSGTVVTKVLGTSFSVETSENDRQVTVKVRTGRVSVFSRTDPEAEQKTTDRQLTGIVLTPNQQLTFDGSDKPAGRTLVERPQLLPTAATSDFEFDNVPAPEIFRKLEQAYGVTIVFDETLLQHCRLTASLKDESLQDKIQLLCQGLDARYELVDGQIVITAKGCSP
jgi:transmembrane sensor